MTDAKKLKLDDMGKALAERFHEVCRQHGELLNAITSTPAERDSVVKMLHDTYLAAAHVCGVFTEIEPPAETLTAVSQCGFLGRPETSVEGRAVWGTVWKGPDASGESHGAEGLRVRERGADSRCDDHGGIHPEPD